jgi:hypothetical protein
VAALAGQLAVRTRERKAGLLAMLEAPETPTVGRMAPGTLRPQVAVMDVVPLMAVVAAPDDIPILLRLVALLARNRYVQTHQRETREVMIEGDGPLPTSGGMTLIALQTELAGMHIARAMAAGAVRWQLLRRYRCGMTGVAGDLRVPAGELPVPVVCVIEARGLPLVISVAPAALGAQASGVRVLPLVAPEAVLGNLVLQVAAAVAILTIDPGVHALERKTGLFVVIEFRGLPAGGGMAVGAFRAPVAPVDIIRGVAGDAFFGGALVPVAEMTAHARHLEVFVTQRVGGLVVIEPGPAPGGRLVASGTIAPQLAFVRLLFPVAVHAAGRGFAERLPAHVTARATNDCVRIVQGKIGTVMIKLLTTQLHDVGVATMVLRVATAAFRRRYTGQVSVKALFAADVGCDLLVTIEAQTRLALAIAAVVAERALLLILGMSMGDFARHEQYLRIHGVTAARWHYKEQQSQQDQPPLSPPHAVSRQYTCTAITWTVPAINIMKMSGMCNACQREKSRS